MGNKRYEPHTEAWFRDLRRVNPAQADWIHTTMICAGTNQCCSVCGDTKDVHDYIVDAEVLTARFCETCRDLQFLMYGLESHLVGR